ncbi:MAG: hypothetical protein CL941_02315 [Desulfobacter sp.]|nr:hypothetical protein [Desulfobacter sp.]
MHFYPPLLYRFSLNRFNRRDLQEQPTCPGKNAVSPVGLDGENYQRIKYDTENIMKSFAGN